jgi:hypothetical protein
VLALLWFSAPSWLFIAAALAVYFIPLFQPSKLILAFALTLILA